MAALLPPVRESKPKWWWPYLVLVLVVFALLWKLAPGRVLRLSEWLSPFRVGTPRISGTVVNAVTGRPVPGMDVCLLVTYVRPTGMSPHGTKVMRSVVIRKC